MTIRSDVLQYLSYALDLFGMIEFDFYSGREDRIVQLQLSDRVISYVADQGFAIMEKIGEGATSIACRCKTADGTDVVLLFPTNVNIKKKHIDTHDELAYARKIQNEIPESVKYMVKLISTIVCPFPYSDDSRYATDYIWSASHCRSNRIEVLELADTTLAQRMRCLMNTTFEEKIAFVADVNDQLLTIVEYFEQIGAYHYDLAKENIAFIKKRLVLIDLESLIKSQIPECYGSAKQVVHAVKYTILANIASSKEELEKLKEVFVNSQTLI